jgi:hypothetical protein
MQLRLRMIDRSEYPIAALAAICAWAAANPVAAWFALHPLTKTLAQGLLTIALGCGAVAAQHFVRRFLNRNWPAEEPPRPPRGDLFDLFRRGLARLRKAKRPPAES